MDGEIIPAGAECQLEWEWCKHPGFLNAVNEDPSFSLRFASWIRAPMAPTSIGQVLQVVANHLGGKDRTVLLSAETYAKQVAHHPEVVPDFYAVLQVMFREGEVYAKEPGRVQFVWEAGTFGFEATVKCTRHGELFLVSFFRAKEPWIKKTRRKCRRVT